MSDDLNNLEESNENLQMLNQKTQKTNSKIDKQQSYTNDSSGHTSQKFLSQARAHSFSPRRIPLFERASAHWWNPQFSSPTLESQYWKCSFPILRNRFRSGLIYILLTIISWTIYFCTFDKNNRHYWFATAILSLIFILIFLFTFSLHYQRFYLPTSFFCIFIICLTTLLIFSSANPYMGPIASLATSIQVVLLIYTVIPLTFYLSVFIGVCYSICFELLTSNRDKDFSIQWFTKLALHFCIHLLGIHLYIWTQVRQRKTFLKIGQSLLARKDLELETQFKDHMIQSVMPKKVAEELLKETSELRRFSQNLDNNCRTSMAGRLSNNNSVNSIIGSNANGAAAVLIPNQSSFSNNNEFTDVRMSNSVPNVRKFRPFTMNMMSNVSILFADIAGFTKMSSNKSADELVNLLNDLFGRFDYLCGKCNLEKISTLGDCYYCVSGCPEPREDHAKCCVEMGLAMIIAIKQFDIDRGQNVNMRVGIHTGKVMCGMVGTKRFKFDVFSNDVTLANEMESTGVAGRVHISEVTARYLNNQYFLQEATDHKGMKTYFIVGRLKESKVLNTPLTNKFEIKSNAKNNFAEKVLLNYSTTQKVNDLNSSTDEKLSLRKKLTIKLKSFHSLSVPIGRYTKNFVDNDSFKLKLLKRSNKAQTCSTQLLHDYNIQSIFHETKAQKSSSMQSLNNVKKSPKLSYSPTLKKNSNCVVTNVKLPSKEISAIESQSWSTAEKIGGKISYDLAFESSPNNSRPGSKNSNLQDASLDVHSIGGLDTAISHHHNAASLTRFDTENCDLDQRLAQIFHNTDGTFAKSFWTHQKSLNRWTLNFNQKCIENEYRAHFAESSNNQNFPKTNLAKHQQLKKKQQEDINIKNPRYRYSGVFIDIMVSAIIFLVTVLVMFSGIPNWQPRFFFVVYCLIATTFLISIVSLVLFPFLIRQSILSYINLWLLLHIFGCVLIALPIGVALFNVPTCLTKNSLAFFCTELNEINIRLLYSYVFLVAIYGHCNFSQLGAWPKTILAVLMTCIFILSTWFCQKNLNLNVLSLNILTEKTKNNYSKNDYLTFLNFLNNKLTLYDKIKVKNSLNEMNSNNLVFNNNIENFIKCNKTKINFLNEDFGSPLFIWELILDTFLAAVLVAFLNYQFETAFRMSFYGDIQAKRDTAKMQSVRDQADWLLTNIIPQHAVESLKTNTKYSENHNLTAVMFASITNWNEMYEENFEGGREFLRVLNEVFGDFDELLDRPDFCHVEKIKTIGSTYMAASGLNPEKRRLSLHPYEHLYQLMEFALALQNALAYFNQDLLNFEFVCKIGLNVGPVTAGVIGTTKLYYDIWGDTVNIASRMYSTGVENRIQVSQYTRDLLIDHYDFEYRDHIEVKGVDGGMDTYLYVPLSNNNNEKL